jgi:hypothetical protein
LVLYLLCSYLILVGISDYHFAFSSTIKSDLFFTPEFWHFLNPTHKLSQISSIVKGNSAGVIAGNLFARIVQGFLIYQFIRAFRKFYTK